MSKFKVYVYAICKNEEKFVDRWVESMKEADGIYVLDTGSVDNSVDKLKELGVNVKCEVIDPWRFDVARNKSLEMVPDDADICVCTDLDEVFDKGWRMALESVWSNDVTRGAYNYNWHYDKNGNPDVSFNIEKIHARSNYKWTHPVHEVLTYLGNSENKIFIPILLKHYPDKEKSRSSYLKLLEISVVEDPDDDRNMHYLGREYMYYGEYNKAIDTLINHLKLPRATWKDERCASMRFIARCYKYLNRYDESKIWLEKSIKEAPYLRDGYMEMALLYYNMNEFDKVIYYVLMALKIKDKSNSYINEVFSWNYTPYDLLSIALYNIGEIEASYLFSKKALEYNPDDERLKSNYSLLKKMVEGNS
ncbi:MAG: glycosyl transferase family 2 [Bacilli bacterium]|nr:glycosyl transferase family 2 [Bacilli bacterium]